MCVSSRLSAAFPSRHMSSRLLPVAKDSPFIFDMAKNGPFQLCFLLMKLVGITKPGRDDRPTVVYSVQMATLFLMVYLWASLTITMKDPEADIITKLETGLYGVGLTHITCKLMFLRASSVDLVSLLEEMEVGWSEALERPRDRGLMARAERQSGMVPRGLTVMFTVTCLCAFGLATLTGNEPYPGILVPFDRITSPLMHSTIQSLAMFLLVCILLVFYTILASVTLQLSTHIQILCEDLKDIGSDEAGCPEAAEGFRGCVRLHHKIIRY
ncbi:hypothetical protein AAG570_006470 [Ranatra chinensis]|uniref:Uncharacterized protein n=1 Tax=Ranatra chinensis TaxID=642074 RepID=A0ABD0YU55_9HEMI